MIYNWEEGTHLVIKEGYGQTETTLLIGTFKKMSKWVKPGSMGKVAPGYDVRIVNNMGKEVPRGKQGNIGVKVKPVMPPGLFKVKYKIKPAGTSAMTRSFRYRNGHFWQFLYTLSVGHFFIMIF